MECALVPLHLVLPCEYIFTLYKQSKENWKKTELEKTIVGAVCLVRLLEFKSHGVPMECALLPLHLVFPLVHLDSSFHWLG